MATQKPNERLHELNLEALVPEHHNIFENKVPTKFTDPCKDAALQSMRCLERFAHDKTQCHNEFLIYRRCKQTFSSRRRARVPPPE